MPDAQFRRQLVELEPGSPALRQEYERRLEKMMEKPVTRAQRGVFYAQLVVSAALLGGFLWAALGFAGVQPPLARLGFGIGAAFAAGWLVLLVRLLRRGRWNARDANLTTFLVWGFVVAQFVLFQFAASQASNPYRGTLMVLSSIGYLIFGVAYLLKNEIWQAQSKQREELLRLQLQVAELAERLDRGGAKG